VLVNTRLVVTRVTTGTVWRVTRGGPVDDLGIRAMALGAGKVAAVIQRFIAQPGMTVIDRPPGIRVVAQATVLRRIEMSRVLTGRKRAVVA